MIPVLYIVEAVPNYLSVFFEYITNVPSPVIKRSGCCMFQDNWWI